MCGRFTLKTPADTIREMFGLERVPEIPPRYNIAPSQPVLVVRRRGDARSADSLRWGLVPHWADDPSIGHRMINARAETAHEKPAFRDAFRNRRCLVPADGFYEWMRVSGDRKQPFYLHREDDRPFAFAGLWEHWRSDDGDEALESVTILTTEPNDVVAPIHDRMPVILSSSDRATWLDPKAEPGRLTDLLGPWEGPLRAEPVSTAVNDPSHDGPGCIEPVDADPTPPRLFD